MQSTHKIAGSDAQGFARYLTSENARGDYYLSDESAEEGNGAAGVWHGSDTALSALGLSREQPVEREQLLSLMRGQAPNDGRHIRAVGGDGSRVAGIDMTFSASKSVSALWAVSGPYHRAQIEAAHRSAVVSAMARVEREVQVVRTRAGGELQWHTARSLVAAEFMHTSSRLTREQERGGVPDPQLHSHVVVLAAERHDRRFAAVESRELFRSAKVNGAWYRAELAHNLQRLGIEIERGTGKDGRYFEVKGISKELTERWSTRTSEIERAARVFRTRYGREPKASELKSITLQTRGTKTVASPVEVRSAWQAVASEYGLTAEQARQLFAGRELGIVQLPEREAAAQREQLAKQLLADVSKDRSMISERDLRARAYELSAGICRPQDANQLIASVERSGELIRLEGGMWTTRELRELELRTLALAQSRSQERAAPVSPETLQSARRNTGRELSASLSAEQRQALEQITGRGGVSLLVGQAGTGKGVVISTAAKAWRAEGYTVIGTAIAGATAERLGADAKLERSMTTDKLLHRIDHGREQLNEKTVLVMDEAGMADTKRLARVVEASEQAKSKLLLVGDSAQLSPIGAGGLFGELQEKVPTAELSEVHRAQQEWERRAWAQLREGRSQQALASYQAHDRLHVSNTREEAAQRIVEAWDKERLGHGEGRVVMLTDASNQELDRINAMAQERREQQGELGSQRAWLKDRPYGLAAGDQVIFTAPFYGSGKERVENGTLGTVLEISREKEAHELTVKTRGANEREVRVDTREFQGLKLGYAQHVYKAQGLTADRALVLMGGWQTNRERAYVAMTRARERTDVYLSREDLGEQGMDEGAIERLGDAIARSEAQQASVTRERVVPEREQERDLRTAEPATEASRDRGPHPSELSQREPQPRSEVGRILQAQEERARERERGRDHGWGIE